MECSAAFLQHCPLSFAQHGASLESWGVGKHRGFGSRLRPCAIWQAQKQATCPNTSPNAGRDIQNRSVLPQTSPGCIRLNWNRKSHRLNRRLRARLEDFDEEVGSAIVPAPPPTTGRIEICVNNNVLQYLDLSPAQDALKDFSTGPGIEELLKRTVGFQIDYQPANPLDPRELSEYPDVRLWFVRLDAEYPWLPVVLDWKAGEWARYAAMLVPHQMTKREGLVFNPEALELFVMNKLFHGYRWMKDQGLSRPDVKCRDMLKMLGFKVEPLMFEILEGTVDPKALEERNKEEKSQVEGRLDFSAQPPPAPRGNDGDYVPF